jgi:hypothetical protein
MSGMLYLIQEREFIKMKEDVYKFGRTENISQRITQYPKGSKLLFAIKITDEKLAENELLKKLSIEFKSRPDIGREYFQGDYKSMMRTIFEYVMFKKDDAITENETDIKKEKKDETIVMMEYVDENREILNNKLIKSKDFYEDVLKWIEKKDYNVYISHAKMTSTVIKCYGVISKVQRFDKSIDQGLQFPELLKNEIKNNVINRTKRIPYKCPCCNYLTSKKSNILKHFYDLKKPCPKSYNDITLTDEIKKYVIVNRVYHVSQII